MHTIAQNKNRVLSAFSLADIEQKNSLLTLVWHIVLYNRLSDSDNALLHTLIPSGSSIFIRKNDNIIFESNNSGSIVSPLEDEILYSYDATFAQQIFNPNHGIFRLITTPLDKNCLIGLLLQGNRESNFHTEDIFLHKIHSAKKIYKTVLQSKQKIIDQCQNENPVVVINKEDNQIIAYNNHATDLLQTSTDDILQFDIKVLQESSNLDSQRKLILKNIVIGQDEYAVIQFARVKSANSHDNTYTNHLISHTEYLLQVFHELQAGQIINQSEISNKINHLSTQYKSLLHQLANEQITLKTDGTRYYATKCQNPRC